MMVRICRSLVLLFALACSLPTYAQLASPSEVSGGEYPGLLSSDSSTHQHLTAAQRAEIQRRLRSNVESISTEAFAQFGSSTPRFIWPVVEAPHVDLPNVDAVSNYVDHDSNYPNQLQDYNCGVRTYDLSGGYNHAGIDIFLWPFSWNMMDSEDALIVAAAPGVIIGKDDGFDDESCGFSQNPWNAVYIMHGDGSTAWYGHMKRNSTTTKPVGSTVEAGEYLGVVGSSGSSTEPHLHLEIYDANYNLIDPYQGSCNTLNSNSWWQNQPAYYEPQINRLATSTAPPVFTACPGRTVTNITNTFLSGDPLHVEWYKRDQLSTTVSQHQLIDPANAVYHNWSNQSSTPHFSASYWYLSFGNATSFGKQGVWKYQVDYESVNYEHEFYLVDSCDVVYELDSTLQGWIAHGATDHMFTSGSASVAANANATLLAGNKVVFNNGFVVENSGSLSVKLSPVCQSQI